MATPRRKCRLADTNHADIDLRDYEKVITETVNRVVPGKNPRVFKEYFSTDVLSQSESVRLGRALAKIEELNALGKTVTISVNKEKCVRSSPNDYTHDNLLDLPRESN